MIKIRAVRKRDISAVRSLLSQLGYSSTIKELEERILRIRRKRNNLILVAEEEKNILGCIHIIIDTRLAEGTFGDITSLVVDIQSQRKGIGKMLVHEGSIWLKGKGIFKVKVRCNTKRTDAHNFYSSLGFSEIKEQKIFTLEIS